MRTIVSAKRYGCALLLLVLPALPALAQETARQPSQQERIAALKASLQTGLAGQRSYEWIETTAVSLKGEEKTRKQNRCYYDVQGELQKVPTGEAPAAKKPRGVRGRVAANKKEDIETAIQEAMALVKQYLPPDPERIQAAVDAGKLSITPPDGAGRIAITISDYLKAGDSVKLDLDAGKNALLGIGVKTFMEKAKDAVSLDASLAALPDGTIYVATVALDVTSEKLRIDIQNGGHKKASP